MHRFVDSTIGKHLLDFDIIVIQLFLVAWNAEVLWLKTYTVERFFFCWSYICFLIKKAYGLGAIMLNI